MEQQFTLSLGPTGSPIIAESETRQILSTEKEEEP